MYEVEPPENMFKGNMKRGFEGMHIVYEQILVAIECVSIYTIMYTII